MDLDLLIDKVAEKGMDSYRLSKWLGVDRMAIYRKLSGYEPITIREAEILKDILDLTNLEALEIFLKR